MDSETTKAYLAGLKLKDSGLSEEVIYARLEKQGFSVSLARQVAKDIIIENEKELSKDKLSYELAIAVIGICGSIFSYFIFDNNFYSFPWLSIAGICGIIWLIKSKRK